jgi:hypothetical protein
MMTVRISGAVKRKLVARDFDDGYYMLRHLREIYTLVTESLFIQLLQELMVLRPMWVGYSGGLLVGSEETYRTH